MDKNKQLKIILVVLIGIGIFVWVKAFQYPHPAHDADEEQNMEKTTTSDEDDLLTLALAASSRSQPRPKSIYRDWGENPFFREAPMVPPESPRLLLQGISWDEAHPVAVINGQVLGIGDSIEGHTVKDIQKDRILLYNGSEDMELFL